MTELPLNQILCGDCAKLLQGFPDNSIDLVVTDPPYGLSFMGKEWDKTLPSMEAFKEMCRILKPGALAFVMSSPRQDLMARMILLLEDAGFKTDISFIDWIYKTGFPKAYDVSKGIDKKLGTLKQLNPEFTKVRKWIRSLVKAKGLTYRQIDTALGNVNSHKASHYLDNSQPQIPTPKDWDIIKKLLGIDSDLIREKKNLTIQLFEREIIGQYEKLDSFKDGYGVGYTEYEKTNIKLTISKSGEAKRWEGWKSVSGLKPAHEPVLMVYKPRSEKTIVDNVLKWGVGAINVDACRIPYEDYGSIAENPLKRLTSGAKTQRGPDINSTSYSLKKESSEMNINQKGRFPANLLVSDKAIDTGEKTKSGILEPHHEIVGDGEDHKSGDIYGIFNRVPAENHTTYGDMGDQSRYFDLDAWAQHHGFLDVPKPDKAERDFGLRGSFIMLETSLVDEAKCKDGYIIQGAHLARLQVDTGSFPLKVIVESGTKHRNAIAWNTLLFGKNIMEKYQKDFVPIIKTGINSITKSKILNWLTFLLTNEYTVDVRRLTGNGGSRARNAGNSSRLLITTNEGMASALGVKSVVSGTRLIISVKDGRNIHSTVKPVKLMAYLIELGCPPDGVVLDPFVGSGTTCIAAKQLTRRYIGIEIDEEYCRIAEARIAAYPQPLDWFGDVQTSKSKEDSP